MKEIISFLYFLLKTHLCNELDVFKMTSHNCSQEPKYAVFTSSCDQICVTTSPNFVQIRSCQCHDDLKFRTSETWRRCAYVATEVSGQSISRDPDQLVTQRIIEYQTQGTRPNSGYLLLFPFMNKEGLENFLFALFSDGYLGNPLNETQKNRQLIADLDNFRNVTGIAFMSSIRILYIVSYMKIFSISLETKEIKRFKFVPTRLVAADDKNKFILFDMDSGENLDPCIFKASPSGEKMSTVLCGLKSLKSFSPDPIARMVYFGVINMVYKTAYDGRDRPLKICRSRQLFCLTHFERNNEVIFTSENNVLFLSVLTQKLNRRKLSFRSKPVSLVVHRDLLFISLANGRLFPYSLTQRKLLKSKMKTVVKDTKYLLCNID